MLRTRYEEYGQKDRLPFVLHPQLLRTPHLLNGEQNWHEDIELQLCIDGEGEVTVAGMRYPFRPGDIVAIGGGLLHYTGTKTHLTYACLIVGADLCRQMDIPYENAFPCPLLRDEALRDTFFRLLEQAKQSEDPCRTARLCSTVLSLLCLLFTGHRSVAQKEQGEARVHQKVKRAIEYIKAHYAQRISLEQIARHLCTDKYALCRDFKRMTGDTLFGYLNRYRCYRAQERILSGEAIGEAARACGFENPSFFSKTYKRYMGMLPSEAKQGREE